MEPPPGIEPDPAAYRAAALPLSYGGRDVRRRFARALAGPLGVRSPSNHSPHVIRCRAGYGSRTRLIPAYHAGAFPRVLSQQVSCIRAGGPSSRSRSANPLTGASRSVFGVPHPGACCDGGAKGNRTQLAKLVSSHWTMTPKVTWLGCRESNPEHLRPERSALPIELHPIDGPVEPVELTGFEPVFRQCRCRVLSLDDSPVAADIHRETRGAQGNRTPAWPGTDRAPICHPP